MVLAGAASAQNPAAGTSSELESRGAAVSSPTSRLATAIDIASLTKDSDFTVFMRPGVTEEVHIKALRMLWTTDSIYNQVSLHE
jgi:hypothetical protein